ncbi:MAG: Dabb family protein [Spirochaetales bacterium]
MVKHIVFWNVKDEHDGMSKAELIREIKSRIEGMRETVPTIKTIEVGVDFNKSESAFEIALYSTFEDRNALDEYQRHPAHEQIKTFVGAVTTNRAVVDYEV